MAIGFNLIPPEQPTVDPHKVALDLAGISEMLEELETAGIERGCIDEEDASLVQSAWEMFVRTFVYMYLAPTE